MSKSIADTVSKAAIGGAMFALFLCPLVQADEPESGPKKLAWRKPKLFREVPRSESTPSPLRSSDSTSESREADRHPLRSGGTSQQKDHVEQATFERRTPTASQIKQAYEISRTAKTDDDYSTIITMCEHSLRGGTTAEAEKYASKLISWALNRRGELSASEGREQQALDDFEEAIRFDKTRWRALHNRGVSYALIDQYEDAIADFNRTIEINPKFAKAYFNRGELISQQGKFEEAIRDYDHAIKLSPEDPASHNSRGYAYYTLGKHKHAVRDFTEALRLDDTFAPAYANRGLLYSDLGYYPRSLHDFQQAVKIDSNLGPAYRGAAWVLATCPVEKFRDKQKALAAASKAIELDGDDDPSYLDALAAAHANAGEFELAVEAIEAAMERADEDRLGPLHGRLELYRQGKPYRAKQRRTTSVVRKKTTRRK